MEKTVAAFPVLEGKSARGIADMLKARRDEYSASRRGQGIRLERAFEQVTPMGTFIVVYVESDASAEDTDAGFAKSDLQIDRDFIEAVKEIHGIDLAEPPPEGALELLTDWVDEEVSDRRAGFAFCAPIRPDAAAAARDFAIEAWDQRRDELVASRRALGVTHETVMLNHTPAGDVICVYLEGDDPVESNREFAASQSDYDVWFKSQCAEIFIPQVDFNQPVPPVTQLVDSEELFGS